MKFKSFLAVTLAFFITVAQAQWAPSQPVKVIIGLAPGNAHDLVLRQISKIVTEKTGVTFVPEYHLGQETGVSLTTLSQRPGNGQTIALNVIEAVYVNVPVLFPQSFKTDVKKLRMATMLGSAPLVFVVKNDSKIKTVDDLIRAYREQPISVGTTGPGPTIAHNLLFSKTGSNSKLVAVNYKTSPAGFTDLIGGVVDVVTSTSFAAKGPADNGQLRVIAATHDSALPVPIMMDHVPGFRVKATWAIFLPPDTPNEIVNWYATAFGDAIKHPDVVNWFKDRWGSTTDKPGEAAALRYADAVERELKPIAIKALRPVTE
jgi:tripartite-type tricarboxylate transporter receptor subunit TctC